MGEKKAKNVELHREFYPLSEAADIAGLKIDDLIHMAARGELSICVNADGWSAAQVYEIDHSIDISGDGVSLFYRGPDSPEFPSGDDDDFADKVIEWQHGQERQDLVVHNIVRYGRRGVNGWWYRLSAEGPAIVAAASLAEFLVKPETAHLEIDINAWKNIDDQVHQRFFRPDPEVLVKDALQDGRLVLLTADVEGLRGGEMDLADEDPKGLVRRDGLLKLIIGMAVRGYTYDPAKQRNNVVGDIDRDLQGLGLTLGQDSIRKVLKEASQLLPGQPQKS